MARSFNGSSTDYIDCSNSSILNPKRGLSVSAWGYLNVASGYQFIFSRIGAGGNLFSFGSLGTSIYCDVIPGGTPFAAGLSANAWYHYGFSVSAPHSSGDFFMCINGKVVFSNNTGTVASASTSRTMIGTRDDAFSFYNGRIAHVAMWGATLTPAEHILLARGVRPNRIRPLDLVGYWPLAGIQSPEPDLSGYGNNGVLNGTGYVDDPPLVLREDANPSDILWVNGEVPILLPPPTIFQRHFRFRTDTDLVDNMPTWGQSEDAA